MKDKAPELKAVNVLEYQAEMTAYIVSSKFELDTEDYSTHYLASWTKREVDDDVYLKSLEEVKEVSSKLIDKIVENYNKLEVIKEQENTPLQQIESLKDEIKERELDKFYADSFEQSAQIREDIERKEEKIYNLIKDNELEDDPALNINDLPMNVSDKLKENNNSLFENVSVNSLANKSAIIPENDNFAEIYKQNLKANSISVEVKDENKKSHILNIVTEDITKEKLDKYTEGMTGKEWLQEDLKTSIIEDDENKSLTYPIDKVNTAEFTPIDDVKQNLDKAHTQSSPAR